MYRNLDVLIFQYQISKYEMSQKIGITYNTLLAKIAGKQPFKLDEAFLIHKEYFPNEDFGFVFTKEIGEKSA